MSTAAAAPRTGANILVECLIRQGVDVVFASAERASEGRARNDADRSRPAMVAAAPAG